MVVIKQGIDTTTPQGRARVPNPGRDLEALLGDEDFSTTQRYAHLAPDAHGMVIIESSAWRRDARHERGPPLMTRNEPLTWVGVAGFEPAASSSRTKRAAKMRYTPLTAREV
jgi:hypothetical protein